MASANGNERVHKLTLIDHNLANFREQKQQFHAQLLEVSNALSEVNTTRIAYKVIGGIMVEASKEKLQTDLAQKQKVLELRLSTIENQEKELNAKANVLRQELLQEGTRE